LKSRALSVEHPPPQRRRNAFPEETRFFFGAPITDFSSGLTTDDVPSLPFPPLRLFSRRPESPVLVCRLSLQKCAKGATVSRSSPLLPVHVPRKPVSEQIYWPEPNFFRHSSAAFFIPPGIRSSIFSPTDKNINVLLILHNLHRVI